MRKRTGADSTASQRITNMIAELADWRGKLLVRLRKLILQAAPGITEEWKWNAAVWTSNGMICAAGAFQDHPKQADCILEPTDAALGATRGDAESLGGVGHGTG